MNRGWPPATGATAPPVAGIPGAPPTAVSMPGAGATAPPVVTPGAGVPAVAILVSGRPMIVERELDACDVFVAAWLPGSEGAGVADVLFGEVPFRGRLPMPWPASLVSGAVASSYNPLHPAGFGLTIDRERTTKFDNAVTVDYKTGYSK